MIEYSREIAESIKNYMNSINMKYAFDEEDGLFTYELSPNSNFDKLNCYIWIDETAYYIISELNITITDDTIESISALLNEINYSAIFTNFVFDINKKKVYCQCYTNCKGIIPSNEIIAESLFGAMVLVTKYGEFIFEIAEGKEIDKEAFQKEMLEK